MRFPYMVKHNGINYAAGEDVPIEEKGKEEESLPFSDSEIVLETAPHKYTRAELDGMTVKEIRQAAEDLGITITRSLRSDIVSEFLMRQKG